MKGITETVDAKLYCEYFIVSVLLIEIMRTERRTNKTWDLHLNLFVAAQVTSRGPHTLKYGQSGMPGDERNRTVEPLNMYLCLLYIFPRALVVLE